MRWSGRRCLLQRSDSAAGHATAARALLQIRQTPTGNKLPLRNTRPLGPQSRQPRVWPPQTWWGHYTRHRQSRSSEVARQWDGDEYSMFSEKAGGHTGYVHVFIGADRGWGAADITLGHRDTNYGFNLLLHFELTPLHLAAAISTCDILTISLKSLVLPCLNFFFLCLLNSHSPIQQLDILTTFIFWLRSQCLTLLYFLVFLISLL